MHMRSFTWFLLLALACFVWGARDALRYHWNELTADGQIKWAIGLSLFFLFTLAHQLSPFFIQLFF